MRAGYAISVLAIVLVASGCGARKEQAAKSSATRSVSGSTYLGWDAAHAVNNPVDPGTKPLVKALAVFSTPRGKDDALPPSASNLPEVPSSKYYDPGPWQTDQSRLLLSSLALAHLRLYGVPSENGWVCLLLFNPKDEFVDEGNCEPGLVNDVAYEAAGNHVRFYIYGLVADSVGKVYLITRDRNLPVPVARNAFFFEASVDSLCPADAEALLVVTDTLPHRIPLGLTGSRADYGCR